MARFSLFTSAALAGVLALSGCDASGPAALDSAPAPAMVRAQNSEQGIPDQYIVVFKDHVADAPGLARRLAQGQGARVLHAYQHAIKGFAFRGSAQAAEALKRNPNVAYVEPDQVVQAVGTQNGATWGLDRSDARTGLDGTYTYNATGAGVRAYIIDTGIRMSHADLAGRVSGQYFDAFGGNGNDGNGHGTHVAGTVGGTTWGVAKGVQLFAVRVLDDNGSGTTSGVIAGVDWVTANHVKPAVANMSLGGGASTSLDQAVANSIAAGVSYAVAAGNGDRRGRQVDACTASPARVPEAITIGATDNTDRKASWSNYGNCVDFFAPGVGITSAWYTGDSATNTISGTSMATPHVAGAAALYLETAPTASPQTVRDALYNATTKGVVTSSSTANNHLLYTLDFTGGGGEEPPVNTAPVASFTFSCADLACAFDGSGSSDADGDAVTYAWDFGDGTTGSGTTASHTYAVGGTYTATLTVTDGTASNSDTQNVTVSGSSTGGGITLSASGSKVQGRWRAALSWSPAGSSSSVDVYRDGVVVTTTANDGAHTDQTTYRGSGSLTYKVCEAGTSACSNAVTVTF